MATSRAVVERPAPRRSPLARGWVRALLALALAVVIASLAFDRATRIEPPAVPPSRLEAARATPLVAAADRASVGPDFITRRRGIWELHLEGDPFEMGFAHARLGARLLMETEEYMFREMARYVPSRLALAAIRAGVRLQYRHLGDHIPPDRALEIAGQAAATVDLHGDFLPAYHRMAFYHALHDITQRLEHSPLLGCTGFAAGGKATKDGHLLVGRNFDFEGPEPFDRDKAVLFFKPTGKIPFASVAWTGMTGVVTGINAERIYVSLNAARSDDKGKDGIPVELLVRDVLERARSIDDVVRMVGEAEVMVPDFYLVADGKTGESAVIERSPHRIDVRRSFDVTPLANHARSPGWAHDVENERLETYLTSGARLARVEELLARAHGSLDPEGVLAILRDKKGAGDVALGLGNRNALDAIIATHSVVVDATDLVLWVGQGPHLLGKYVGFDLRKELLGEERPDPRDLPEDAIRGTPALRSLEEAQAELRAARTLQKNHPEAALVEAERAAAVAPMLPEPQKLVGDLLVGLHREAEARAPYERFLTLHPPYLADVEAVRAALAKPPPR